MDLSHPEGARLNDGIEPELCSLQYTSVDEAVERVLAKEPGAMMVKMDIEGAYRRIPVHLHDRPSHFLAWSGKAIYLSIRPSHLA